MKSVRDACSYNRTKQKCFRIAIDLKYQIWASQIYTFYEKEQKAKLFFIKNRFRVALEPLSEQALLEESSKQAIWKREYLDMPSSSLSKKNLV